MQPKIVYGCVNSHIPQVWSAGGDATTTRKLLFVGGELHQFLPAAWQSPDNDKQRCDAAQDINDKLNAIVPNDRLHPAEYGVHHRHRTDEPNAERKRNPHRKFKSDGAKKQPQAVAEISRHQEQQRSDLLSPATKPLVQYFVRR